VTRADASWGRLPVALPVGAGWPLLFQLLAATCGTVGDAGILSRVYPGSKPFPAFARDNNLRPQLSHAESIVCLLYQLLTRPVLHTSQVLVFKCEHHALTVTAKFEHTIPGLVFHRKLVPLSVWHGQQLALQPSGAL
jgi:hypothetical protein